MQGELTFFEDRSLLPADSDVYSLGYSVLLENGLADSGTAHSMLDSILAHADNGKVQVWLSRFRAGQLDHVVGANVVYFANLLGRANEVEKTQDWITNVLDSGEYLEGSRYYHSPDSFLYFLGKSLRFPDIAERLKPKLGKHLQCRMEGTEYPLDLAMRVAIANSLNIPNETEKRKLIRLQEQDGSWPFDSLYRQGKKPVFYGNKSIPTTLSIKALNSKSQ